VKRVARPVEGKAHQRERRGPACPIKGKVQEGERRVRRVEEEEAVCMAKPQEVQQGREGAWRRSPLPLIAELINSMGSKKVFMKMDLRWGFNNVRIKEGNEWKGAFITHIGSFEPTVMFFGMTNSPATFQAMMNEILRDLINEGKVAAFVDDVLVGTETVEGHNEIVKEILRRLKENDLYIKPEKCMWKARKIGFLGVVIGPNGIEMEIEKVERVLSWPQPKNIKDIRKFLGLANYYRRFIKDFAWVARLMNVLTQKDEKW